MSDMVVGLEGYSGERLEVDPLYRAARVAMRPLDYTKDGVLLGHYAVAQASGNITATLGAAAHCAGIRWSDTVRLMVLMRLRVGWGIVTAVTTAVPMSVRAIIARGFSVDFSSNNTQIDMATVTNTQKMRASMGTSLLGTKGPNIMTTAAMSGQTLTADAAPFAAANWEALHSTTATGTAVALQAGSGGEMKTIYECTANAQHPIVLTSNEGVLMQSLDAGPGSGTFKYYVQWEWAEVVLF